MPCALCVFLSSPFSRATLGWKAHFKLCFSKCQEPAELEAESGYQTLLGHLLIWDITLVKLLPPRLPH